MTKNYIVTAEFWRKGLPVSVGTELALSDVEVKYLKHALKETKPKSARPEPAPADLKSDPEPVAATDTVLGASVEEQPSDASDRPAHSKRRQRIND